MNQHNADIRSNAKAAGVHLWEIASALNYSESRFCVLLRQELTEEAKAAVHTVIHELSLIKRSKSYTDPKTMRSAAENFRREVHLCHEQNYRRK